MEDPATVGLNDYKFTCFNGEPQMLMVCSERTELGPKVTFLDLDWNRLPFERHYPASDHPIERPKNFDLMIDICKKLAVGMPFVRVDLYEIKGKVYFGELTLYPGCGFEEFRPDEWDKIIGSKIKLPQ